MHTDNTHDQPGKVRKTLDKVTDMGIAYSVIYTTNKTTKVIRLVCYKAVGREEVGVVAAF